MLVGLVSRRHDDVPIGVAVEHQQLKHLVPRHKLEVLIKEVFFGWLLISRVDVEADHTSDKVLADQILPGLLRSTERDLNLRNLLGLKPEMKLRVGQPCLFLALLLVLLVVEVAASWSLVRPPTCQHRVLGVFKLQYLNGLGREDREYEIGRNVFLGHRWHNDEWTLCRLIVGVNGRDVLRFVVGFFEPFSGQDLQLSLEADELGGLDIGDVVSTFLVGLHLSCRP